MSHSFYVYSWGHTLRLSFKWSTSVLFFQCEISLIPLVCPLKRSQMFSARWSAVVQVPLKVSGLEPNSIFLQKSFQPKTHLVSAQTVHWDSFTGLLYLTEKVKKIPPIHQVVSLKYIKFFLNAK